MKTEIITAGGIDRAAEIIRAGGLVAVPTETVYGLAGSGLNAETVERIYAVKGRPEVKPLSLMVHDASAMAACWREVPAQALSLAEEFWPGPLTIIGDSVDGIPEIVRAGGSTVGLRCPDHPLTLELLQKCAVPLAAPSANPSGKPSPKTAREVLEYFDGQIDAVIDGGECGIGTESTIVTLSQQPFRILRRGALAEEEIAARLAADMYIIGLTGGSGTGKTTALNVLRSLGACCIDADELYHTLTRESEPMRRELIERFGEVYNGNELNRKAYVTRETLTILRERAMAGDTVAALDAIGIFEAGLDRICAAVFGVLAPEETRVARLMNREGISREYALKRIRAQKSDEYYMEACTACLINDGTVEEFAAKCKAAFTEAIQNGRKERLPRRALL